MRVKVCFLVTRVICTFSLLLEPSDPDLKIETENGKIILDASKLKTGEKYRCRSEGCGVVCATYRELQEHKQVSTIVNTLWRARWVGRGSAAGQRVVVLCVLLIGNYRNINRLAQ